MSESKTSDDSLERTLAFLHDRWTRPLDITTVEQARKALGLPPDDELRWRLYEHLQANPGSLATKTRYGVSASTVTLTNEEKLAGRALVLAKGEDEAQAAAALDASAWERAKAMLRRIGLLSVQGWRPADDHERLLDGVGLLFHTVRARPGFQRTLSGRLHAAGQQRLPRGTDRDRGLVRSLPGPDFGSDRERESQIGDAGVDVRLLRRGLRGEQPLQF